MPVLVFTHVLMKIGMCLLRALSGTSLACAEEGEVQGTHGSFVQHPEQWTLHHSFNPIVKHGYDILLV